MHPGPTIAIALEPWRAVYVEIPKVACTSIKVAIAGVLDIKLDGPDGDPHQSTFPFARPSFSADSLFPGYFSFAFVRNPWDRLVSCYRDKIAGEVDGFTHSTIREGVADCLARFEIFQPGMTFASFAQAVASIPDSEADEHFRSQYTFVSGSDRATRVDFIGRFEALARDIEAVCRKTGMPSLALPHLQAAGTQKRYADYYDPALREAVAERYAEDIERFCYRF